MKRRGVYLAIALSVIPIGLIARSIRNGADATTLPGFIATYLADTLWAVMFFFLFAATFIRGSTWRLCLLTLGFTVGIEASQLYTANPSPRCAASPLHASFWAATSSGRISRA